jgi:CheY-like chemotaxis protein
LSGTPSHKTAQSWKPLPGGRPNTLGLHDRELGDLLDRYDGLDPGGAINPKRDFVRWPFRRTSVSIRLTHPGGAVSTVQMACRNISRGGLAALHSTYIHPGTRCRVTLPHATGPRIVDGTVVRCIHRSGVVHEIGVSLDQPIQIREYLQPDPLADCFSLEKVNPALLSGTVILADGSEIDRRLFKHFLRNTPLQVFCASSVEEALNHIGQMVDLVVADAGVLADGRIARATLASGQVPLLVTSSEASSELRGLVQRMPDCAFVAKPWSQRMLLRAIAEFLVVRGTGAGEGDGAEDTDAHAPELARSFAQELPDTISKLERAMREGDAHRCRQYCLQIAGTAPAVGFKSLGSLASAAAQTLGATGSVGQSHFELRALVTACRENRGQAA